MEATINLSDEVMRKEALEIFEQALAACSVEQAFQRKMRIVGNSEKGATLHYENDVIDLTRVKHLRVIAFGKAAAVMLKEVMSRLPLAPSCDLAGVLIAREEPANLPEGMLFFAGGHPLPNQASFEGARAALKMLDDASVLQDTFCLYLISGGASAMMELPLDPSISLKDTIALHRLLVHSGASIAEINCIRKHFSAVKGGRLALAAAETPCVAMLVSDVPPQSLDSLASGPTLPDTSTVEQCHEIISRYHLRDHMPDSVQHFFDSPALQETPKPGIIHPRIWKLLDSNDLAEAACVKALEFGFHVVIDNTCDDWNYSDAADYLLERLRILRKVHPRVCLISTGEVTVRVPGDLSDRIDNRPNVLRQGTRAGGRNQHFALYLATLLTPSDSSITILSAGSDGIDGNSHAAGAVVDSQTLAASHPYVRTSANWAAAESLLEQARQALDTFDSFTFLDAIGATIITGPTGNNVRDLRILLAAPSPH